MHAPLSVSVAVTTDGSGAATAYSPKLSGAIESVAYVKTDFTVGVDFTITTETTRQNVWVQNDVNASATVRPRGATHSTAGVASLYASGGTAVQDRIVVAGERIKIVIASGGDTHTGTFVIGLSR